MTDEQDLGAEEIGPNPLENIWVALALWFAVIAIGVWIVCKW